MLFNTIFEKHSPIKKKNIRFCIIYQLLTFNHRFYSHNEMIYDAPAVKIFLQGVSYILMSLCMKGVIVITKTHVS